MGRIKGWVFKTEVKSEPADYGINNQRFVEEIPKTAIRGEIVAQGAYHGADGVAVCPLPARLIGKKVSFIIIPEEN